MSNESTKVTPFFRVSFPQVFQKKFNKLAKRDEYSLQALFPEGEKLEELKRLALAAAVKRFGPRESWPMKDGKHTIRFPFRDQGDREKTIDGKKIMPDGYVKGALYLNLRSKDKPKVLGPDKQEIIDPENFYAGCWARAVVSVYAYDQGGNKGVNFGLVHLQKWKDDEPFTARPRAETAFEALDTGDGGSGSDDDVF